MTRALAALIAGIALSGCASLHNVDVDVSSFSRWPAERGAATYAFERLPSQQANPQQAQMLEDTARPAIEGAGLVAAPEGGAADVTVQVGARITETALSPYDDPFWYGGMYPWPRPFGYGRYRGSYWGPYWGPYWGGGWGRGYWGYYNPYYQNGYGSYGSYSYAQPIPVAYSDTSLVGGTTVASATSNCEQALDASREEV